MDDIHILNTKLYIPYIRQNQVFRDALNKRLDKSCQKEHKVILVSAPAGYGKTTLVSEWTSRMENSCTCWLSLDEYDNDPIRFMNYLIAAIRRVDGSFGKIVGEIMLSPKLPGADKVASYVIKELEQIGEPFILVLDDYHVIDSGYINELMQKMLDSTVPGLVTVIITRQDPAFTLSRWRAKDRLTELRAWDLRFATEEIEEFFDRNFAIRFDKDMLRMIEERTEGWAASLQLTGLSLKNMGEAQARSFVEQFKGNNRFIIDYLVEEVLERQRAETRDFLRNTCVLKRFSTELCDYVLDTEGSRGVMEQLERENLFMVPLDSSRTWYRYHHLFAEFLQIGLDERHRRELNRKASLWCSGNGLVEEALEYALEAEDGELAEQLLKQDAARLFQNGEFKTLLSSLNSVSKIREKRDALLDAYRAWCLFLTGDVGEAYNMVCNLEQKREVLDNTVALGTMQALASLYYINVDRDRAARLAEQSVGILSGEHRFFCNSALLSLGMTKSSVGMVAEAAAAFRKVYEGVGYKAFRFMELTALINYMMCLHTMGRRREAQTLCEEALEAFTGWTGGITPMARMLYLTMGVCAYSGNELEKARKYLYEGINFCKEAELSSMMCNAESFYINLLYTLGEKDEAFKTAHRYKNLARSSSLPAVYKMLEAAEIELNIKEKDYGKVYDWMKGKEQLFDDIHCPYISYVQVVFIKALIAQDRLEEAGSKLLVIESSSRRFGKNEQLITILLLKALVQKKLGREAAALEAVREALKIAAPEDYMRNFAESDSEVLKLVCKAQEEAPEFVDRLMRTEGRKDHALVEPLSGREVEILELIASGLSNGEIAASLCITTGTTKWHINNIFGKLGVNKRTQAVERARQYKLIN